MVRIIAATLAGIALWCQAAPLRPQPEVDASKRKETWEAKIRTINKESSTSEFDRQVDALRGFIPHVARPPFPTSADRLTKLDDDWYVMRRPSDSDSRVSGMTVVGLPDHRAQIEADLYEAVRAIERSPTLFWEFDPVNLIRAVNTLQAMSETRAVDALKAYNTLCESDPRPLWPVFEAERIFWITRLLYVPKDPASSLRPPILGMPAVRVAAGSDLNAVFPLVLQDDVPFRLNSGYTLFGVAELPLAYLEYCRSAGKFRDAPLRPSSDPIAAATKFLESGRLAGLLAEPTEFFARFKEDIHGQALSAAGNFIGNPRQWAKKDWMIDCSEADWAQVSEKARIAGAVWSETACDFVATPKKSKN